MIPQYRPIYTPVHVHWVYGSILFPSSLSGVSSLLVVAKLSSGEPGVPGSSLMVSTSPLTGYEPIYSSTASLVTRPPMYYVHFFQILRCRLLLSKSHQ